MPALIDDQFDKELENKLMNDLAFTADDISQKIARLKKELLPSDTLQIIRGITHVIDTTSDRKMICKPYLVPEALKQATKTELKRLKQTGIIRKSKDGLQVLHSQKFKRTERFVC
ncbi:hypothetical protein M153_41810001303 [Pseudoloma neurophilia]|uniref:Transposable element n=1 Tax=Pseudoloma neurophilia TaxID=146866 RepID=A0A0R0LYW1_9MICR|nr:hypothetical protein M153_41810001303 [Pseudoloma neurophilia]